MALIKSISGIRGTVGGKSGENLTPEDSVLFTAAYATWLKSTHKDTKHVVVIGRDARISGPMISQLVIQTLIASGIDVIDLGLSTTPTVEIAVTDFKAHGGIIITASHNPKEWNALKLLNQHGEFISAIDGEMILDIAEKRDMEYADIDSLGTVKSVRNGYIEEHIDKILALPLVNTERIQEAHFTIAVDAVNSTGGIAIPLLLDKLGVKHVHKLYCEPNGQFPHNPEPLPAHLTDLSEMVVKNNCDLGIAVDPDVDRLAMVCEDGSIFGEEYTLVAVADFVLNHNPGNTVSNLSSTRALRDISEERGVKYEPAAVGEVNVVKKMKEIGAVIGGEGNGGVIYPALHYGRDAMVGIALFLTHLASKKIPASALRDSYPTYVISKNKIELNPNTPLDRILEEMASLYRNHPINTEDGLRIEFKHGWVHLRKSNTEPIIRIYAESQSEAQANQLALYIINQIKELI